MSSVAPINSPQSKGTVAHVTPIAGKTTPYGYELNPSSVPLTPTLPLVGTALNITDLATDAVGVVIQDSVRSGTFQVEPKLVASYVSNTALYEIWGSRYVLPLLTNIEPSLRNDIGKMLWNSALMPATAKIFGGKISLVNAILTSAGTGFFSKGIKTIINRA
jgi:hypothetical protein